jgi:hypothetical protein
MKEELKLFKENKKGDSLLISHVIFIIISIVFFVILINYVANAASQYSIKEQIYSKQIALLIDKAKPGTTIELDISFILDNTEYEGSDLIKIDNQNKLVIVKLRDKGGYSYVFFNSNNILWSVDAINQKLKIEVVK